MQESLNVLLVEDSEDDTFLILRELQRDGFVPDWERVQTATDLQAALDRRAWQVVI